MICQRVLCLCGSSPDKAALFLSNVLGGRLTTFINRFFKNINRLATAVARCKFPDATARKTVRLDPNRLPYLQAAAQEVCRACTRLDLECVQSEVFCTIPADKPPSFSRRKRLPRPPAPEESTSTAEEYVESASTQCLVRQRPTGVLTDVSQPEAWLFQYYVERLSGLLVNAIGHENPLRSLVVPRAACSPLLLRTVCAVSALHRSSNAEGDERTSYQTVATAYYVRALSDLRSAIVSIDSLPKDDNGFLQTIVLGSIFLCKYEIIKDGVTNWRRHLEGLESFCKLLDGTSMTDVMAFAHSFITYHKGIASLTEQGRAIAEPVDQSATVDLDTLSQPACEAASLQAVDPYMGFSLRLILLLRRVMALLSLKPLDGDLLSCVTPEVASILKSLAARNWTAEHFQIPAGMTLETIARLEHVSRAYENAVYVCLHSVLSELAARGESGEAWTDLLSTLPVRKEDALAACVADINLVPCNSPEEAGLLPMLFIVACETDDPEQMETVLSRVTVLDAHVGLGNIRYAAALLREVSQRRMRMQRWHDWRGLLATTNWDLIIT